MTRNERSDAGSGRPRGAPLGRMLLMGGALVAMAVALVSLMPPRSQPIPDALIGVWTTDAPTYAGRPFEIDRQTILFRMGDGPYDYSIHPIRRVTSAAEGRTTHYLVEYVHHGKPFEFAFDYQPGSEATIRLDNQHDYVWTKTAASP